MSAEHSPLTTFGVPRLLTSEEAAEVLSVSSKTLGKLARGGDVPAIRVGTQWRFDLQDLLTWIREQKTGTVENAPSSGT